MRKDALTTHRLKVLAAQTAKLDRATRAYRRETKRLFSRADLRLAAEIAKRAKEEWHRSCLKLGDQAPRWDEAKREFRQRVSREFARSLPGYREWRKLSQAHRREQGRLATLQFAARTGPGLHIDLDDVALPDPGDSRSFFPPYSVFDVNSVPDSDAIVTDDSRAFPSNGHLVNSFDFQQHDDGPLVNDVYGYIWPARYSSSVACGTNFTTPRAGRLRIGGGLRNFANRVTLSLEDRFGFSEAEAQVHIRLFVAVAQGNRVTMLPTTILSRGLVSTGDDESYQLPQLDTTSTYLVEGTTAEAFPANTGLQVLAGCEVFAWSEINDMRSRINVALWWQLKKMTIGVIEE